MHENSPYIKTVENQAGTTTTVTTRDANDVVPEDVVAYHIDYTNINDTSGSANDIQFESFNTSTSAVDNKMVFALAANDTELFGHRESESLFRVPRGKELRVTTTGSAVITLGIRPEDL